MYRRMGIIHAFILILTIIPGMSAFGSQFPLDNNTITGSFAEFRTNHFHTGLDISTLGQIGMPIYAPNDCWVNYIKRDFLGYAKAVFLEDENYIYVFGHLNGFDDKIEHLLDTNKFKQVIYPRKNEIQYKKGEIFAYTGRSGTLIPHLHYEIRSKNNNPINPLLFHGVQDSMLPEIFGVAIEPMSDTTLINGRHDIVYFSCSKKTGKIDIGPIYIKGAYRMAVKTIDKINSQTAKLAPYRIVAQSGLKIFYDVRFDSVSFDLSKISPNYFRGDINVKDNNYLFNLFPDNSEWISPASGDVLYSNIDTNILVEVYDFKGNRSQINIDIIDSVLYNASGADYVKLKKVDDKICVLMSGIYAKETVSSGMKENFSEHIVSDRYKYYILNRKGIIEKGLKVDGMSTQDHIVYIDDTISGGLAKGVEIHSLKPLQFLFEETNIQKAGMTFSTPLYKIKLCDRFYKDPIKMVITGYKGQSLYLYGGGVYSYYGKLEDTTIIKLNKFSSFIVGKDEEAPRYRLLSKKKKGNSVNYVYKLVDDESGVDWSFVADSNNIYNEPDHFSGTVKIKASINSAFPVEFRIRDKEGNTKSIKLNRI